MPYKLLVNSVVCRAGAGADRVPPLAFALRDTIAKNAPELVRDPLLSDPWSLWLITAQPSSEHGLLSRFRFR